MSLEYCYLFRYNKWLTQRYVRPYQQARESYLHTLAKLLQARKKSLSVKRSMCATDCDILYLDLMGGIGKSVVSFDFMRGTGFRGYASRITFAKLSEACTGNPEIFNLPWPNDKGHLCPNWEYSLGRDVDDHISKFYTVLPGLELNEQS